MRNVHNPNNSMGLIGMADQGLSNIHDRGLGRANTAGTTALTITQQLQFKCDQCSRTFEQNQYLQNHKRYHENRRTKCDLCGGNFKSPRELHEHMDEHHEKRFKCEHCSQSFFQRFELITHLDKCSLKKNFNCNQCPQGFFRRSDLMMHRKSHPGVELFQCEYCSNNYTRREKLNVSFSRVPLKQRNLTLSTVSSANQTWRIDTVLWYQPARTLRHVAESMGIMWSYVPCLERPLHYWPAPSSTLLFTVMVFVFWNFLR